jgi:hypothetical protein
MFKSTQPLTILDHHLNMSNPMMEDSTDQGVNSPAMGSLKTSPLLVGGESGGTAFLDRS